MSNHEPTPAPSTTPSTERAAGDLEQSRGLAASSRTASGWYATYMAVAVFGVGFAFLTLLIGLGPEGPGFIGLALAAGAVLTVAALVWAGRRPVGPHAPARLVVPAWVSSGVLYGVALFAGLTWFTSPLHWVATAVVVALPLLLGAARVRRELA